MTAPHEIYIVPSEKGKPLRALITPKKDAEPQEAYWNPERRWWYSGTQALGIDLSEKLTMQAQDLGWMEGFE